MIFKDKYLGQDGAPIGRIMGQVGAIAKAIYHELGPGGEIRKVAGDG